MLAEIDILEDFERKWTRHKDRQLNGVEEISGRFTKEEVDLVFRSLIDYARKHQLSEEELH